VNIDFQASARSTLGVEWELMIVDRASGALVSAASEVLGELGTDGEHPTLKHELLECTVEVITGICETVAEAERDLATSIAVLRERLEPRGLALLCAGTHPISHYSDQQVSPDPRYAALLEDVQWLGRRLQIFGVHVHVGVRHKDKVMPIVNAVAAHLPHLLALSSSSPYRHGRDTGLASTRSKLFESLPTAGLPYLLPDWEAFEAYMGTLIATDAIHSIKDVWWDIRPHPDFGTVELRMCDGLATTYEVGAVAAVAQCLVDAADRQLDQGYTLPVPRDWVLKENKWRAARYGLDAVLIREDESQVPVREALLELARDLAPTADRLGCAEELTRVAVLVEGGSSAQRQRRTAQAHSGDLTAVVASLVEEFERGCPL
jgi:carboxylate-amine ligase